MFNLSIDYNVEATVKGFGRHGGAEIFDVVFATSDPGIVLIIDTENPSVKIIETVSLGQATISVTAKNASGVELSDSQIVEVTQGEAQVISLTFGSLIAKPIV